MTLGTYFLANFYAEFDYSNATMAFSTNVNLGPAWVPKIEDVSLIDFPVTLTNTDNSWTGSLNLGQPQQNLVVTYSTEWATTLVQSSSCTPDSTTSATCSQYTYDSTKSNTVKTPTDPIVDDNTTAFIDIAVTGTTEDAMYQTGIYFEFGATTNTNDNDLRLGFGIPADDTEVPYIQALL